MSRTNGRKGIFARALYLFSKSAGGDLPRQFLAARQDFRRGLAAAAQTRPVPAPRHFQAADDELHRRHQRWRGAQFIHAQPSSNGASTGSLAISPQTLTQILWWCAASTVALIRRTMAGCVGS